MLDFIVEALILLAKALLIFIVVWVVISYFVSPRRTFGNIVNTWYQPFVNQQFSPQEFYEFLEKTIQEKQIKTISVNRVRYGDMFSSREYLQVVRYDQMMLVCAAFFGTDSFVSYRQGQPIDFIQDLVMRIPKIGAWLAVVIYSKSFYKQDTDVMFKEVIHQCVLKAIGNMTAARAERMSITPAGHSDPSGIQYV